MMARRHRPPSYVRYAAKHSTIGIHVDLAQQEWLRTLRDQTGMSYSQLFLAALGEVEVKVDAAFEAGRKAGHRAGQVAGRQKGRREGFDEAVSKYLITVVCSGCSQPIAVEAGTPIGAAAVAHLNGDRWHHPDCPPTQYQLVPR